MRAVVRGIETGATVAIKFVDMKPEDDKSKKPEKPEKPAQKPEKPAADLHSLHAGGGNRTASRSLDHPDARVAKERLIGMKELFERGDATA